MSPRGDFLFPSDHWHQVVGQPPHAVTVFEHPKRKRMLYLRWRGKDGKGQANWEYRSLRTRLVLVDGKQKPLTGRALRDAYGPALRAAEQRYAELAGHVPTPTAAVPAAPDPEAERAAAQAARTIGQTEALIADPATGRYAGNTRDHRNVRAAVRTAVRVWGADTRWVTIRRTDYVRLWRAEMERVRSKGGTGLAMAKAVIERVVRAVHALLDAELLDEDTAEPPRNWQLKLQADFAALHGGGDLPEVRRPRHSGDDLRQILAVAPRVDPRIALGLAIGAELRPGQVLRMTRDALTLPLLPHPLPPLPPDGATDPIDYGTAVVRGRGNKRGTTVDLSRAQRRAIDVALDPATGYLRELEAWRTEGLAAGAAPEAVNYLLFVGWRLTGGALPDMLPDTVDVDHEATAPATEPTAAPRLDVAPVISRRVAELGRAAGTEARPLSEQRMRALFRQVEKSAGVTQVKGRVWYGLRRVAVDEADALNISTGALQHFGGWASPETPMSIYKDRASRADRRAARDARERIRGERPTERPAERPTEPSAAEVRGDTPSAADDGSEGTRKQDVNKPPAAPTATDGHTANPNTSNDL